MGLCLCLQRLENLHLLNVEYRFPTSTSHLPQASSVPADWHPIRSGFQWSWTDAHHRQIGVCFAQSRQKKKSPAQLQTQGNKKVFALPSFHQVVSRARPRSHQLAGKKHQPSLVTSSNASAMVTMQAPASEPMFPG